MTTLIALALVAQVTGSTVGSTYSHDLSKRYWLGDSVHGAWEGRTGGPLSVLTALTIVREREAVRANSALAFPSDLHHLQRVLTASNTELLALLSSKNELLVSNAITEAFLRRGQLFVEALSQVVNSGNLRASAIGALAAIGGNDAEKKLEQLWYAVRHPIQQSAFADRVARGRVAAALVRLGNVTSRRQLDDLFRFSRAEGRYLCPLLARSGMETHLMKLRDLTIDATADHLVRKWAAAALGEIGDREAVGNLRLALSDSSRQVHEAAEKALQQLR